MQKSIEGFDVLGVRVHRLDMQETLDAMEGSLASGDPGYVVFCTVSTVLEAQDNLSVRQAIEDAMLVTPDGMPLVWLGRRVDAHVERVYGPDLMMRFLECTKDRYSHYFFGAMPHVLKLLEARLEQRVPQLRVAGAHAPDALSTDHLVRDDDVLTIQQASPDVVWVALGHPKQELWMRAARERLPGMLLLGVGAAFDFHSGVKREAPDIVKRMGLQWLHRLASEPRRLWRRYLIGNARFLWLLARQYFRSAT